ncbi:hypothetical protein FJZ21_00705 [Candidatus Pacearchaeota archaeon]|nr:hypothetical protein [Candidatus Pacearchaeota archaeon]
MEEFARTGEVYGISQENFDGLVQLIANSNNFTLDILALRQVTPDFKGVCYEGQGIRFQLGCKDGRFVYSVFGKDEIRIDDFSKALVHLAKNYSRGN